MTNKFEADSIIRIIGLIALFFVIIVLLSTPSRIIAKQISVIDTELSHASGDETSVRTKMDFGSNAHVQALPGKIGDWQNIGSCNKSQLAERLDADVMHLRAYYHPSSPQPVFLLIIQSDNRSSFHPPIVCYPAVGYKIEAETTEEIFISNLTWVLDPRFPNVEVKDPSIFNGSMFAKKLVISKEANSEVTKRKVVLYFYVKDNPFISDTVTMIRVSAHAPLNGSYEVALNLTKEFMGEVVPYMFEVREEEEIIVAQLAKSGVGGWLIIGFLVSIPAGIFVYPRIKKRNEH